MKWGPRMTPTSNGDNVILTYETSIYTLSISGSNYEWMKLPHDLSISRQFHVQALVPASTIQCKYGMLSFYKNTLHERKFKIFLDIITVNI